MAELEVPKKIQKYPTYRSLNQYILGQTRDPEAARDEFCKPVETEIQDGGKAKDVEKSLGQQWQTLIAMASTIQYGDPVHSQLVTFLQNIQDRPDVEQDGKPFQVQEMTVWKDLPLFGWEVREAWNGAATDESEKEDKARWVNTNAFVATLLAAVHESEKDTPDVSLFAIWSIRTALEDQEEPESTALAAAAVWLVYAAGALRGLSAEGKSFDGKSAKPGALFKDESWNGFCKERWNAWGQRLAKLKEKVGDQKIKQLVESAGHAMQDSKDD
ncbi:hypothetical protein EJ03DRAFT_310272 [Teratosphaeria nubilosa]|uniref:Uncharacterized protein n=1 Tax=Teratosphaeria nubilosa TaxID=161662 RepID=A0A6G1LCK7_9PEZI|nr:hypothetical protein EJ03DRAFT_310272 [Teratosphaeria nubilosa]